ncbi:thiamine pyrophosphate-dependent enzyme [Pseudonocardia lutea]|uniref:dihydrolipoyllysine-residue succinyltransferase n=1 Tax=Pseudonocardia lutea TaxID=2172015 RepID=A0ABW1IB29_9PSEU
MTATLPPELSQTWAESVFRQMALARAVDVTMTDHLKKHRFDGWYHPGMGQEAAPIGACAALRTDDYLFYQGRGTAWAIGKGMGLGPIFGDLFGRTTGATRGKGGGVPHWADPEIGLMGEGATLGSVFPLAGGAALAEWIKGSDRVALADFGDGAAARGTFHETLLEAATWKLPLVLFCENNLISVNEPFAAHSPTETVAERAAAYGIPGVRVDGQDAVAVYEAVTEAVGRARRGEGPTLIEARVYRVQTHAHGVPDPTSDLHLQGYRDPLDVLRATIGDEAADRLTAEADAEVAKAYEQSLTEPKAGPEVLGRDVFIPSEQPAEPELEGRELVRTRYAQATGLAIEEEMRRDPTVFVFGQGVADGGWFGGERGLAAEFGARRVLNTGITEAFMCGAALGASLAGLKPILQLGFGGFTLIGGDEVYHKLAKWNEMHGGVFPALPSVIIAPIGPNAGSGPEHGTNIEVLGMHFPGLKVVVPGTAADAKGLLKAAVRDPNPVLYHQVFPLQFDRAMVPADADYVVPIGKAKLAREGSSVTLVTYGYMLKRSLKVAEELAAEGIEVEVVDLRSLVPLDWDTVYASVAKTGSALVVHDAALTAGPGAEIVARIAEASSTGVLPTGIRVRRLGALDAVAPQLIALEEAMLPSPEAITEALRDLGRPR